MEGARFMKEGNKARKARSTREYASFKKDPLYSKIRNYIMSGAGLDKKEFNVVYQELTENTVRLQTLVRKLTTILQQEDLFFITNNGQVKKNPLLSEVKSLSAEVKSHFIEIVKLSGISSKEVKDDMETLLAGVLGERKN
jgi:hypothetical protein